MKLLRFFKKSKKEAVVSTSEDFIELAYERNKINKQADTVLTKEEVFNTDLEAYDGDLNDKSDRERLIKAYCEQIVEANKQNDDAKLEYQAVTDYLTDIQKIDRIHGEDAEKLYDAARNIVTLQRERHGFQRGKDNKLTEKQISFYENNESHVSDDIKRLEEYEKYNTLIKNDMRYLEGEKGVLRHQKKELNGSQKYLKNMAVSIVALVVTIFVLLFVLQNVAKKDMQIPFLITSALAAAGGFYIFLAGRKNEYDIKMTQMKLNKAIAMLNTVKIKYVNNMNCIDYLYKQFHVNSAVELVYQWEQYLKLKRLKQELAKNTEKLNEHHKVLLQILETYKVKDAEIWLSQSEAIIDSREMVEIRHRLNVRREKIRDRISYNTDIVNKGFLELKKIVELVEEAKTEVAAAIKELHITID